MTAKLRWTRKKKIIGRRQAIDTGESIYTSHDGRFVINQQKWPHGTWYLLDVDGEPATRDLREHDTVAAAKDAAERICVGEHGTDRGPTDRDTLSVKIMHALRVNDYEARHLSLHVGAPVSAVAATLKRLEAKGAVRATVDVPGALSTVTWSYVPKDSRPTPAAPAAPPAAPWRVVLDAKRAHAVALRDRERRKTHAWNRRNCDVMLLDECLSEIATAEAEVKK